MVEVGLLCIFDVTSLYSGRSTPLYNAEDKGGKRRYYTGDISYYRLEMQAKLDMDGSRDVAGFWGDELSRALFAETDSIVNLASKEYSMCISRYLPSHVRMITCVFGEEKEKKIIEKGTMCKMARGEMVRYMAGKQIKDPEKIRDFCGLNYRYSEAHSDERTYVFVRQREERSQEFE